MSKFIISSFADEIANDLDGQIATLLELNIHHVEMRGVNGKNFVDHSLEEAKAVKEKLDANGIKLSAIGSPLGKIGINDDFEPHFEKFKHTIELAKLMGTKYIRMFSFFIPEGEDANTYSDKVIALWKRFQDYAKDSGVILLHENEKGIYGDIPSRCKTLLDSLDFSVVKGIFDPANFVQCGAETLDGFELLKDKIVYIHIKDARKSDHVVVPVGEGDGNVAAILKQLADSGFEGFLSLEPHLATGDIAVCGAEKFKVAHTALMSLLATLDVEVL